ncbi:MAG: DMT family transporter [Acidimicrobiia bacterium]|nr:DMT family transporter [Acidimicrobiia bacterium]
MNRVGVIRCLAAAVLFGASAPAASSLVDDMPVLVLAGLLYIGAGLAVLPAVARRPPTSVALAAEWRSAAVAVVVGGAVGPALLVAGLARSSAASASILLNLELVATVAFAATLFREHLGRRLLTGSALVVAGGVVLAWEPGAEATLGALFIAGACAAWGLDNGVTARIEQLAPGHVVLAKGVVAGSANLLLGWLVAGNLDVAARGDVVAALVIGAVGYGLSITLWVKGARDLGAARGQLIFATAPFIGAAIAWIALGESVEVDQLVAIGLCGVGVAVSLDSAHEHRHEHEPLRHDHEHRHDDGHHDHRHAEGVDGRHSHPHTHAAVIHSHPHVPDLHHRHDHGVV